ncbi:GIY-YIG nuclease family protein [Streptomyces sp. NPDC058698]|uniref:GIY-YIG nuclease family protein n=1 Tax=Streptomyces sp. NPDC058698 TaxID=3346606 RepID=UPI003663F89A
MANRTSTQNLRKRVHYHYLGNAAGSTLRLTLGCLLGLELRRVGSGKRMTFGKAGEATLSQWMADNARVCWIEQSEPWDLESRLISQLDLPLNLDQNRHNAFRTPLRSYGSKHANMHGSCPSGRRSPNGPVGPLPGPSLGRPRSLSSGQQRPMTTARPPTTTALTSENPAHQDLRQDPGQEEVARTDQAPCPQVFRRQGACLCTGAVSGASTAWSGRHTAGPND